MASASTLLVKDDNEILVKALKISLGGAADTVATPRGGSGDNHEMVVLSELADELRAEAGDATSAEAVAARWADLANRRSLFDRALVGRLSSAPNPPPVVDYLVGCFARCMDLRARKGSALSAELAEIFDYVTELCVSYSSIALLNPSMFPQPAEAEAEGVLRLLRPLKADALPAAFLVRLVAKFVEEDSLAELGLPLFAKLAEDASKVCRGTRTRSIRSLARLSRTLFYLPHSDSRLSPPPRPTGRSPSTPSTPARGARSSPWSPRSLSALSLRTTRPSCRRWRSR